MKGEAYYALLVDYGQKPLDFHTVQLAVRRKDHQDVRNFEGGTSGDVEEIRKFWVGSASRALSDVGGDEEGCRTELFGEAEPLLLVQTIGEPEERPARSHNVPPDL